MLDEADEAMDRSDWEVVLRRATEVLALDPNNAEASQLLGAAQSLTTDDDSPTGQASTVIPQSASDSTDTPTSFADDRYQVSKFLGEGGKKRVYLAHDTLLDREVAFALIKTEGLDEIARSRITREAQAMGRLGTHQNIVTVFDLGTEGGSPYLVTELMGGGDIEGVLEDADENRLSLERTIEIGKAVCEGLEFAHARDIVHRDLKPGNVWLTDDGIAKIGDFGLAVMTDRSRLTREGMMAGTPSYLPPEQATGGDITPKADLYSLGAMLYEMVTGRPPFLGDDDVAIISQHINTAPVAPTWHNGDCPRPLEALIMRLLAKDPSERPDSAQDAFNALDAIDLTIRGETVERESTSLESLAGGVFVGRQAEMDQLKGALEDVLGGSGRLLTLVGEPGIGKTRTSEELATYAGLRNAQTLWGRCYETGGQPPYWPWIQAIRSYVRAADADELRRQMGSSASVIAEIVTDVKDRLPEVGPPPDLDDPAAARFRLFDAFTSFLRTASQDQPLILILDDLHWSDEPSLALLEFVAREIGQSRVLIVGTYRDMELNRRHPLTVTLGDLSRERLFERVLLRGLTQQDIARFIEIAAGLAPPAELSATVHRHTEGNPLFVTEVVRELVQSGELAANAASGESTWSVRIPEGVREVIGRRLDRLSERANEMLTTAAVIGRDFTLDALKELAEDTTEGQLLDVLDEALDAKIIEELTDALGHYQFTHALMQQTLTDELSAARTVRLHARIGEVLERIYGDDADAHAAELVPHFAEAEPILGADKLIHYSITAGEQAMAANAAPAALEHFERAMATWGDREIDERGARMHWGLGASMSWAGSTSDWQTVWNALAKAFNFYYDIGDSETAIRIVMEPTIAIAWSKGPSEVLERAMELASPGSVEAGWVMSRLGVALWYERGDVDRSRKMIEDSLKIAEAEGLQILRMRCLASQSLIAAIEGQLEVAASTAGQVVEIAETIPDLLAEGVAHSTLNLVYRALGHPEKAYEQNALTTAAVERRGGELIAPRSQAAVTSSMLGNWARVNEVSESVQSVGIAVPFPLQISQWTMDIQTGEAGMDTDPGSVTSVAEGPGASKVLFYLVAAMASNVTNGLDQQDWFTTIMKRAETRHAQGDQRHADWVQDVVTLAATIGCLAPGIDDSEMLESAYQDLSPREQTAWWFVSVDRVLGRLAVALQRPDDAVTHLEDGLEFGRKSGYRPELAWTCSDYAEMLLDRDEPGDREKAIELQDEALAITQELGMRPLTERILARREILKA